MYNYLMLLAAKILSHSPAVRELFSRTVQKEKKRTKLACFKFLIDSRGTTRIREIDT